MLDFWIDRRKALEEFSKIPGVSIYRRGYDDCDPNFDIPKNHSKNFALVKQNEQILDNEIKYFYAIVAMALIQYDTSFNEEYNKIAIEYDNGKLSKEELLEEISYLKMAIKLANE